MLVVGYRRNAPPILTGDYRNMFPVCRVATTATITSRLPPIKPPIFNAQLTSGPITPPYLVVSRYFVVVFIKCTEFRITLPKIVDIIVAPSYVFFLTTQVFATARRVLIFGVDADAAQHLFKPFLGIHGKSFRLKVKP
jgi:hypothetical protein